MPFGLEWTAGISGHYSEAWAVAPWLGAEACRSWWKPVEVVEDVRKWVEDREGVGRGAGGTGEVREGRKEVLKRSGRPWESAEEAGRHRK